MDIHTLIDVKNPFERAEIIMMFDIIKDDITVYMYRQKNAYC